MNKTTTLNIADVIAFIGLSKELRVNLSDGSAEHNIIPIHDIVTRHPEMIRKAMLAGFMGKLGNVSKAGVSKKLGKQATDKDLFAARARIIDGAWMNGEWNLNGSGPRDSITAAMRDCYVSDRVAAGKTVAEVNASISATVASVFGKEDKATFNRFLDAVATLKTRESPDDYEAARNAIEAELVARVEADRKVKAEAEAAAPVVIDAESLGF